MIDSLVAYPLDPVQLEMGLNVIGCASPKIFYELSVGLQEDADSVVLGVGEKTVLASKSIIYIGRMKWIRMLCSRGLLSRK